MVQIQSLTGGLTRNVSVKKKDIDPEIKHAKELAKEAKNNKLLVSYRGNVKGQGDNFASVFSKRGEKGINQDRAIVWKGDHLVIANIGDSRAVLATISDEGNLVAIQLTVDLKPNLPQETARITQSKGRVRSLDDEPGVYRVWIPNGESIKGPGLAISRAFGDRYIKAFGLISDPEITHRKLTRADQFAILATDGVWDVISNEEAVNIVSLASGREESAKILVQHAARAWKYKKPNIAIDDISVICLFFHSPHHSSYDQRRN